MNDVFFTTGDSARRSTSEVGPITAQTARIIERYGRTCSGGPSGLSFSAMSIYWWPAPSQP